MATDWQRKINSGLCILSAYAMSNASNDIDPCISLSDFVSS